MMTIAKPPAKQPTLSSAHNQAISVLSTFIVLFSLFCSQPLYAEQHYTSGDVFAILAYAKQLTGGLLDKEEGKKRKLVTATYEIDTGGSALPLKGSNKTPSHVLEKTLSVRDKLNQLN